MSKSSQNVLDLPDDHHIVIEYNEYIALSLKPRKSSPGPEPIRPSPSGDDLRNQIGTLCIKGDNVSF